MGYSKNKWIFSLIAFITLGVICFIETYAVESFDLWWHLKSAQIILTEGFPSTDIFSATTPDTHWFPYEWLAEIIFYLVYWLGNINGLILLKAIIAASTWGIVLAVLEKQGVSLPLSFFAVALGFSLTLNSWPLRPLIFSFFFFAIFCVILFRYQKHHLWLPVIIMFWTNIHPSFYLGILSVILFYGGQIANNVWLEKKEFTKDIKRFLLVLGGCFLASLIHPRPQEILLYPLTLITSKSFMGGISEWRPAPFFSEPLFYLTVFPICALTLTRIKKIGPQRALPLLVFALYAFTARRHIPLFALIAAIILPLAYENPFKNYKSTWLKISLFLPGALILFISLMISGSKAGTLGVKSAFFPEKAVQFIKEKQLAGPMYNTYDWGGYLIWRLYPETKTFIDGRNSNEELFYIDRKIREAVPDYQQILDSYQINFILTNSTYFDSGRLFPLIEAIYNNSQWSLVYQDETALLLMRNSQANQELINNHAKPKENIFQQVISESLRGIERNPRSPQAFVAMGKAYMYLEDYALAEEHLKKALEINPELDAANHLMELIRTLSSRHHQTAQD